MEKQKSIAYLDLLIKNCEDMLKEETTTELKLIYKVKIDDFKLCKTIMESVYCE